VHKFNIVHFAEDMAESTGGIPAVVKALSLKSTSFSEAVSIFHAKGEFCDSSNKVRVYASSPSFIGKSWSWSPSLVKDICSLSISSWPSPLIFHIHGVWSAPQYFASRIAYSEKVPFILSSHGMLEPWLWINQGFLKKAKKNIYWNLLVQKNLERAGLIHAITNLERDNLRILFPKNRIEVIPNAIEVSDGDFISPYQRMKRILFVGRIEPKKGVDILLHAFAKAKIDKCWAVDIVGPVWSTQYMDYLKAIISQHNLSERVRIHGPLFGDEKSTLFKSAWVMAVPSHSEVVGLVNLEAAKYCLPTITTHQTGLDDWAEGGGILIEPSVESLQDALESACFWTEAEQRDRGLSSRRLLQQRYSWKVVSPLWEQLYSSLIF
jgi:glycosyltransferase involved in cell wall biosynthesis